MMSFNRSLFRLSLVALLASAGARAADVPGGPGATAPASEALEEITVTAQRRTQQAQDVPIVVDVVS